MTGSDLKWLATVDQKSAGIVVEAARALSKTDAAGVAAAKAARHLDLSVGAGAAEAARQFDMGALRTAAEAASKLNFGTVSAIRGIDKAHVSGLARALGGFGSTKLGDVSAFKRATEAIKLAGPITTRGHIAEMVNEMKLAGTLPGDVAHWSIAKSFDTTAFQPRMTEALKTWRLSPGLSDAVSDALRAMPKITSANLAPLAGVAMSEAIALAGTDAVAEVVEPVLPSLDQLSPERRQEFADDLPAMIAALVTLVAILAADREVVIAGAVLWVVATLVPIYRHLAQRDER